MVSPTKQWEIVISIYGIHLFTFVAHSTHWRGDSDVIGPSSVDVHTIQFRYEYSCSFFVIQLFGDDVVAGG